MNDNDTDKELLEAYEAMKAATRAYQATQNGVTPALAQDRARHTLDRSRFALDRALSNYYDVRTAQKAANNPPMPE